LRVFPRVDRGGVLQRSGPPPAEGIMTVDGTPGAEPVSGFASLSLNPKLLTQLTQLGYHTPTPIQRDAIPVLLQGRDLVGLAATGTGKTAAFGLPLLHRLAETGSPARPSAIILVPTRELAVQVANALTKYGQPLAVSIQAIYGGTGFSDQVRALKQGVDVIVATPGRALDHLRRGTVSLSGVTTVVLDEADEMLDMGFAEDIEAILSHVPKTRQTMLFSATMPPRIAAIAENHLKDPVRIQVARETVPDGEAPKVRQAAYLVARGYRAATLARILDVEAPRSAIVFCRTRQEADELADGLIGRGFKPESLHGGLSQEQRDRVMKKFRAGSINLLIATDVAARGLDISHLSHVINYHVPQQVEVYVHRTGRVGRAGREGVALTLLDPRELPQLRIIERVTKQRIPLLPIPSVAELQTKRRERIRQSLREFITAGGLDEYLSLIGPLGSEFTAEEVALAAVKLAMMVLHSAREEEEIPAPAAPRSGPGQDSRNRGSERLASSRRSGVERSSGARRPRPGMVRLYVGAGRDLGVVPRELVNVIENEVGLSRRDIGSIDVADRFSLVEVPESLADDVIEILDGGRIRGRKVQVRRDKF